jgi:putative glycosyltransferase (TIGR04372 family)
VVIAVTQVFRIRSLLCQNKDGWTRFIIILLFYSLLTIFVGYPLAMLQRISFSVLKIRICILPTNYLGHFVFEADRYISLNLGTGYRTYFTTQPSIANSYFLQILKQRLKFFPRFVIVPIYLAQHTLPRTREYVLKIGSASKLSDEILVKRSDLWFSIDHLDDYPIKNKVHLHSKVKPIITFFLRDADFRSELNNPSTLSSSNYRDVTAKNYIPLARSLSSKFSIVKMGRGTKYRQDQDNKFWYNYSVSQDQSDFNDFLLVGNSDICVTTDSGSTTMPLLFRKKIVQTNLSLFGLINGPSSPFVTLKDFRSISSGKLLSLKELFELNIHLISDQKNFDLLGVEVVENSQEDLNQLTEEIEALYSGIWRPNKLNREVCSIIQKQFAANCHLPKDTCFANSWISNRPWFLIDLQI